MHIGENNFKMKSQLILALLVSVALSANLNTDGYKDVDLSSIEVRTEFPAFNINDLTQSSTDSAVTNEFQFGIIRNAQKDNTIAVRSIDSLFSRLPSSLELDEIVMSADSVSIFRTIQNLISNDAIPCNQAFAYALELLGRIRTAIERKEFGVAQLQIIIDD